jgi:uncharacterized membrane protein SirB2
LIKNIFKNISKILSKCIDDILLVVGVILLTIGVFKIFIPAGYILLGICFIAFAFFIAKKGG